MTRWLLASLWFACCPGALAGERGSPPIAVHDPQTFDGAHISTNVAQQADGRLLVANMVGLMRFDGVRWTVANHPQKRGGMEHLSLAPDGRIFTSFDGDIGWFADDEAGALRWHSVLERLPPEHRSIGETLDVSHDGARASTWFATREYLLHVPDDPTQAPRVLGPGLGVLFAGLVAGEYWVQQMDRRLSRVDPADGSLAPVPGGELAAGVELRASAEPGGGPQLIAYDGSLYVYRDGRLQIWSADLRGRLDGADTRTLLSLRDGRFMTGSSRGELWLLGADGRVLDRFDGADGLTTPRRIHGLFEDRDGDIWIAQDLAVVQLGLARALTVYDASRGLPSANDLVRWRGEWYASSTAGLFRLKADAGPGGGRFERALEQPMDLRSLAVLDDRALLLARSQVSAVEPDAQGRLQLRLVQQTRMASSLTPSRFVPGRVWLAHADGIVRIQRAADGAIVATEVSGAAGNWTRAAELDAHTLWVADRVDGVHRIDTEGRHPRRHYGEAQGLPAGQVRIHPHARGVWFTTLQGLRLYDAASDRFVVPPGLPPELQRDRLFAAFEDPAGNLWVRGGAILNDVFWREDAGWRIDGELMHAVAPNPTIFGFAREGDIAWAIRATGLLRFDLAARRPLPPALPTLLTAATDTRARAALSLASLPALDSQRRDLRLLFAQPALLRADATHYRSRLSGYDDDWSEWGTRDAAQRIYTNLPDGEFGIEVEARDVFGRIARLPPQALAVAPPWWRSPLARAAYLGAGLCALWLAARLGSRRRQRQMLARQRELEATVAARTEELRASNAQLAEQAERLAEVDRLKTRFFVNVGHEFRTPLTLVLGPIDDLLRDTRERLTARAREQLELALRNARRVLDLIVELLDVNRFEHGQMRLTRQPTELEPWLRRFAQEQWPLAERHGHALELSIDPPLGSVAIDPVHFERALGNLVSNAAKYMPRGGRIGIHAARAGEQVRVEIVDQGRGIAPDALPHVFDRFFQAEGSDRASGYGIGLSLVREIVEAHGGTVSVASTPGEGSRFMLTLPSSAEASGPGPAPAEPAVVGPDPGRTPSPPPTDAADPARARRRVLVVDDHADLRRRVRELLAGQFEVIEAEDGPSAWRIAQAELPDLVVADVMMPGFDGIELTRRLRADADTAALGILLLTARAGSEHAVAGLAAGANDYLAKPFDASELLARADAILGHAERLRLALQRAPKPAPTLEAPSASAEQRWRARLQAWIEQHVDDVEASVEALAAHMHADRSALFRRCKESLGMSPSEYLREARLKRAHALLERAAGNIAEISYATGFDTVSGFTRAYKARFGEAPAAALARARAAVDGAA